jgi:hypothetical protein
MRAGQISTESKKQVTEYYDQTGIQAVIFASKDLSEDFYETATTLLVQFGRNNYVELFT